MITYTATPDAVGDSLALSALVGSLPLLTFFAMLLIAKASDGTVTRTGVRALDEVSLAVARGEAFLLLTLGFERLGFGAPNGRLMERRS